MGRVFGGDETVGRRRSLHQLRSESESELHVVVQALARAIGDLLPAQLANAGNSIGFDPDVLRRAHPSLELVLVGHDVHRPLGVRYRRELSRRESEKLFHVRDGLSKRSPTPHCDGAFSEAPTSWSYPISRA